MKKHNNIVLWILFVTGMSLACGGGMMAYNPSSSSSSESNKQAGYFIINKGISSSVFDVKSLQPVFGEVRSSGNARNEKNHTPAAKARAAEKQKSATADSVALHASHCEEKSTGVPALNLEKIH